MSAKADNLMAGTSFHPGPIEHDAGVTRLAHAFETLRTWAERAEQRRALSNLTPRQLDDIGVSLEVAAAEAAKPFWQA